MSAAQADVANDLINSNEYDEIAYRNLSAEHVENNLHVKVLHIPLSKMKLMTFTSMQRETRACKAGNRDDPKSR